MNQWSVLKSCMGSSVVGKGDNGLCSEELTLYCTVLNHSVEEGFENNVGKGENAGTQHFLLCPQCLLS